MRKRGRDTNNTPMRGRPTDNSPVGTWQTPTVNRQDMYQGNIDYTNLGERLKAERKKLHYTQEQVAEMAGLSSAFIGHIERAERSLSLDTLIKLCNLYRVSIDYLLAEIVPPTEDHIIDEIRSMLEPKTTNQKAAILDIMKTVSKNI